MFKATSLPQIVMLGKGPFLILPKFKYLVCVWYFTLSDLTWLKFLIKINTFKNGYRFPRDEPSVLWWAVYRSIEAMWYGEIKLALSQIFTLRFNSAVILRSGTYKRQPITCSEITPETVKGLLMCWELLTGGICVSLNHIQWLNYSHLSN